MVKTQKMSTTGTSFNVYIEFTEALHINIIHGGMYYFNTAYDNGKIILNILYIFFNIPKSH